MEFYRYQLNIPRDEYLHMTLGRFGDMLACLAMYNGTAVPKGSNGKRRATQSDIDRFTGYTPRRKATPQETAAFFGVSYTMIPDVP